MSCLKALSKPQVTGCETPSRYKANGARGVMVISLRRPACRVMGSRGRRRRYRLLAQDARDDELVVDAGVAGDRGSADHVAATAAYYSQPVDVEIV